MNVPDPIAPTRRFLSSIFVKVGAITALCALLVAGATFFMNWQTAYRLSMEFLAAEVDVAATGVAKSGATAMRFGDVGRLAVILDTIFASDDDGDILAAVILSGDGAQISSNGAVTEEVLAVARKALAAGDKVTSMDGTLIGVPILNDGKGTPIGSVAVLADQVTHMQPVRDDFLRSLLFVTIPLVVSVAASLLVLRRLLLLPLRSIGQAMSRIARKDFAFTIGSKSGGDEINEMRGKLELFRHRMAEIEESAQQTLFRSAAFSGTTGALMMVNRDLVIIDQNEASLNLFISNQDEFRQRWPDFDAHNLIGTSIDRFHANPAHQRAILSDPKRLPHKADISVGSLRIELNISAIYDENGEYSGNVLEWRDVGEIRLSRGILNTISSSQCLIEYTTDGAMAVVNKRTLDVLGYSQQELVGKKFSAVTNLEDGDAVSVWGKVRDGETISTTVIRKASNGDTRYLDMSLIPVMDGGGKVYRVVEISTDITETEVQRRESQEERRRMQKAQTNVVSSLREALSRLADGDLTSELEDAFDTDYEELRINFNLAMQQLRSALGQLAAVSGNVQNGAREMSQAA
ncbi:MAG: PAS domain-containing protein, partial [Paracoccaceae bacterium]|nr:PAS domain-containing protein [Paracoccaceae bacterium]